MITLNVELNDIDKIKVEPSMFESSSLLFAYGQDIYYRLYSPERLFDRLEDDYNYAMITISLSVLFIGTVFAMILARNSKINLHFK